MRILILAFGLLVMLGCNKDDLSYISIQNETPVLIYAVSYSASYSDGDWIQPGVTDEFYSISIDHLNGFEYFSAYYDSLLVFLKDHEDQPVKFYKDGRTINYDPELNPFINRDVWQTRSFNRHLPGSSIESLEEKKIYEDYFSIEIAKILSLSESSLIESDPAP